jgi:hypothetical protein
MSTRKNTIPDNDPDYLPPQLISGTTDEERDAEVALRIKDCLIKIMNAMGNIPEISEGEIVPDVDLMLSHYETLGVLIEKMEQRLERLKPPPKASNKNKKRASKQRQQAKISNGFD